MAGNKRYILHDKLGQGGMGEVYRAYDRLQGQMVALKHVRTGLEDLQFNSRNPLENARTSLVREFQTLANLRHPNIVSVLDFGFDETPYFSMTLVEGAQTIREAARGRPLLEQARMLAQLLQALAYLHRHDILHRDLKPGNVLVDADGQVRVVDFGLAINQAAAVGLTGTLTHMPPELFHSKTASVRSDLYAVGIVAYESLTGLFPYGRTDTKTLIRDIMNRDPDVSLIAEPLQFFVQRLLAKDPLDRYASANDALRALTEAIAQPLVGEDQRIRESYLRAAPFIGREAEIGTLSSALDAVQTDQRCRLFLIGGESGVGKSRLLNEIRILALVKGMGVLQGHMVENGGLPYQLWRNVVRPLLLSSTVTDAEASVLKRIVPDIEVLLNRTVTNPPYSSPTDAQQHLIQAIGALLRQQAQPMLILLEDLHWAEESLGLLQPLLAMQLPMLVIGTYRSDDAPNLPNKLPQAAVIPLQRLTDAEIHRLSAAMLGDQVAAQTPVIDLLQRETEGNALFLVEVVQALADDAGELSAIGNRTLPASVFAGGVQKILQRRLQRLPDWAQPLTKLAAVMGRFVDFALLAHAQQTTDLDAWLDVCANAAVLMVQDGRWLFSHDKLRDVITQGLTPKERQQYHLRAAVAIEQVYADNLDDYAALLADHFAAAGKTQREAQYAMRAGTALQHVNYVDARRYLERALALQAYEQRDHPQRRKTELQRSLGNVLYALGEVERALHTLATAQAGYEALGDALNAARVEMDSANIEVNRSDANLDAVAERIHAAIALFQLHDQQADVAAATSRLIAIALFLNDEAAMLQHARTALDLQRKLDDPRALANAMQHMGIALEINGRYDEARTMHHEAIKLKQKIKDEVGLARSYYNLSWLEDAAGNLDLSIEHMLQALGIFQRYAMQGSVAAVAGNLARLYMLQEDWAAVQRYAHLGAQLAHETQMMRHLDHNLRYLGHAAFAYGDLAEAGRYFWQALGVAYENRKREEVARCLMSLARLAYAQNDMIKAARWFVVARREAKGSEIAGQIGPLREEIEAVIGVDAVAHIEQTLADTDLMDMAQAALGG